jgi:hypothetical protein
MPLWGSAASAPPAAEGDAARAPSGSAGGSGGGGGVKVIRSLLPTRRRLRLDPPAKLYFPCKQFLAPSRLLLLLLAWWWFTAFDQQLLAMPFNRFRLCLCSALTPAAFVSPLLFEVLDSIALSRQGIAFRVVCSIFLLLQLSSLSLLVR